MNRQKFLTLSVAFLFLLNLGTIGYLLIGSKHQTRSPELFQVIIEELNLDKQQQDRFLALRDQHRNTIDKLDQEFATSLTRYLQLLKENEPLPQLRDSLENSLAAIEKKKVGITLDHFQKVKALCRPDQGDDFEQLIPKLMPILLPPKNPHPPRRN